MGTSFIAKLIAASLVAIPVAVVANGSQPAPDAGKAAPAAEKKICKQLPSSSSRLPQRVCLTAAQWKQVEADSQ